MRADAYVNDNIDVEDKAELLDKALDKGMTVRYLMKDSGNKVLGVSELTYSICKRTGGQRWEWLYIKSTVKGLLPLLPFVMHLVVYNEYGGVNRVICMNNKYLAMKVRNISAPAKGRLPCMA